MPTKLEKVQGKLSARLDELSTAWMVDGAEALTEQRLVRLAALVEGVPELESIGREANELAVNRDLRAALEQEPFSRWRALLEQPTLSGPAEHAPEKPVDGMRLEGILEQDAEMLSGFMTEAQEHLEAIEEQILQLERDPSQLAAVHAVFRGFHTIKGLAGFLGLSAVQTVSHEVETLLDHARAERFQVEATIVDLVLESAEYLREDIRRVNRVMTEGVEVAPAENRALLRRIAETQAAALAGTLGRGPSHPVEPAAVPALPGQIMDALAGTVAPSQPAGQSVHVPAADETLKVVPDETRKAIAKTDVVSASIRIDTMKLDQLMDMVGEMVIAQSILSNNPQLAGNRDPRLLGDMAQLVRITGEVQRRAMSIRMMPIGPLFQKNAKLVRDLARRHGKQVDLQLSGESTELDKTIAEELSDPLLHMIRNALDHGIETPEERAAAGKGEQATLRLSAEHQSGKVVISIADDGRGLDADRILRKAVEKGIVAATATLSQAEIFALIFAPGFSTAEKITDISGRGVGMDVVQKHVEKLRGHIEIQSELGRGTTFFIHLPLTLAIIQGLIIGVGGHHYIVPVFSVREMFRPEEEMLVPVHDGEEMILLRGRLYPLVRLYRRFGVAPRSTAVSQSIAILCEGSGVQFCLLVDDLIGRQEVVIKGLGEDFGDASGMSGCAVLGDGSIGLILDMPQIFRMGNAPCLDVEAAA